MQIQISCTAASSDVPIMQLVELLLQRCMELVCRCVNCNSSAAFKVGGLKDGAAVQLQTSYTPAAAAIQHPTF
jgi:hypothetical protein